MPDLGLGYALRLPPAEAIRYLERRAGRRVSWNWWETWQEAHAEAFTVAKMASLDLLADTRAIVDHGIAAGLTERQIAAALTPRLQRAGWWGRVVDPVSGETVRLGSARRLKTIIRTNTRVAFAAGRERQQRASAGAFPYWEYVAVLDPSTRHTHREMHGKVFRADDPAWNTIYPPNGFGCRCRVRALSARQVRARGREIIKKTTSESAPFKRLDKRTGKEVTLPGTRITWREGGRRLTFRPDAGWSYNPGRTQYRLPPDPSPSPGVLPGAPGHRSAIAPTERTWKDYGLRPAREIERTAPKGPELPNELDGQPITTRAQAMELIRRTIEQPADKPYVRTPVERVLLDRRRAREAAQHLTQRFGGKGYFDRHRYAPRVLETLRDPDEIWITWYRTHKEFRRQYVKFYAGPTDSTAAIVAERPDGQMLITFFRMTHRDDDYDYMDDQVRRGVMWYAKEGKPRA